jgi:hypothetical protein
MNGKERYWANREKSLALANAYYAANREARKATARAYYAENPITGQGILI